MSHAYLVVLMPQDVIRDEAETRADFVDNRKAPVRVKSYIDEKMSYYDEGLSVPEYDTPCICIGHAAREAAAADVVAELGEFDAVRCAYHALPAEEKTDENWKAMSAPWIEREKELIAAHPDKDKPTADCTECHGTGVYKTTLNPNRKWDWYVIGGRYNGLVCRSP